MPLQHKKDTEYKKKNPGQMEQNGEQDQESVDHAIFLLAPSKHLNPNIAKVEDAVRRSRYRGDPRRQGWATTELSRSQAVVTYREPLTILRGGG